MFFSLVYKTCFDVVDIIIVKTRQDREYLENISYIIFDDKILSFEMLF